MTRRELLTAAVAAGTTAAGRRSSAHAAPSGWGPFDVAIVGAGTAGLASASILRRAGRRVVVLEARGRTGGRTYTEKALLPGVPFDIGGQWFHQASTNPLLRMARSRGYRVTPDPERAAFFVGRDRAPRPEVKAFEATAAAAEEAILAAGARALAGEPDISAAAATAGLADAPFYRLYWGLEGGANQGVEFDQASCLDNYNFLTAGEGNVLIRSGMGSFIADRFGQGVPVVLRAPVRRIDWSGKEIRLTTPRGVAQARRVIVTVPISLLQEGRIAFTPPLPEEVEQAFGGLVMGLLEKIALVFDRNVFGNLGPNEGIVPFRNEVATPFTLGSFWGTNAAVCFVGANQGRELSLAGSEAMIDYALGEVAGMLGSRVRRAFVKGFATRWLTDPWSRGSYSSASPGRAPGRQVLGKPVADRIYFAGEAVSVHSYQSVRGAYETGAAAAKRILSADAAEAGGGPPVAGSGRASRKALQVAATRA